MLDDESGFCLFCLGAVLFLRALRMMMTPCLFMPLGRTPLHLCCCSGVRATFQPALAILYSGHLLSRSSAIAQAAQRIQQPIVGFSAQHDSRGVWPADSGFPSAAIMSVVCRPVSQTVPCSSSLRRAPVSTAARLRLYQSNCGSCKCREHQPPRSAQTSSVSGVPYVEPVSLQVGSSCHASRRVYFSPGTHFRGLMYEIYKLSTISSKRLIPTTTHRLLHAKIWCMNEYSF